MPAAPDLVAYCSLGDETKTEKPPPRMPTPRNCECDSITPSDWGSESNDSLPIEEYSCKKELKLTPCSDIADNSFLQKQFSILENYERNHSRSCSVSHEKKVHKCRNEDTNLDDIANFLDDNNRTNIKLEKYVVVEKSDIEVMSKKSRSLPRNYESNNGYHQNSNSLPRTLDSGKDFIRDMKRYGSYRPKSHYLFSTKSKSESIGSSKKHGFIDKLKNMFGKKSQVHLTEQHDSNNTWLYKDKNCNSRNSYTIEKVRGCVHSNNYDNVSLSR